MPLRLARFDEAVRQGPVTDDLRSETSGAGASTESIVEMRLDPLDAGPDAPAQIDDLMLRLSALLEACRKQSLSVLVPMGEEMSYRYQEMLIAELLRALTRCKKRLPARRAEEIS